MQLPTDIAVSLVDKWCHDFNVKLSDFAIVELTRRIATAIGQDRVVDVARTNTISQKYP